MTFDELTKDTDCKLLDGAEEDYESVFCHKIKYNSLRDYNDFRSYWEREDIGPNANPDNCERVRKQKAVSMDKCTGDNYAEILSRYCSLFGNTKRISPGLSVRHCCKLRLNNEAGVVKPTATSNNPDHCSLFKSDQFSKSESIFVIEIVPLGEG